MKTLVLESMPDLFWHEVKENGWSNFFHKKHQNTFENTEIIIIRTNTNFTKQLFDEFPDLKLIIRAGTGVDNIDIKVAQKRNIVVCNTPEANAFSAYEHTISFVFALIKQHQKAKESILNNSWKSQLSENMEISDLRVLIVGLGRVGTRVAKTLLNLGADVLAVDPYLTPEEWEQKKVVEISYKAGLEWCNMLSFHCPLTRETRNYFSLKTLQKLQNPIWLLNTARGGVVQEKAIEMGFQKGTLLGVALDVFSSEPWKIKEFAKYNNVILTPHTGSFTKKAKQRMALETLKVWSEFVFDNKIISSIDYRFY